MFTPASFLRACCVGLLLWPLAAFAAQPRIARVAMPEPGTYNRSLVLRFTLFFDAPVHVVGMPRLPLNVGGATRYAHAILPLDSRPSTRVDLEYTPQPFDAAPDGIAVTPQLDLNGGGIVATDGTPAEITFVVAANPAVRVAVLPAPTPTITSVAEDAADSDTLVVSGTADGDSVVTVRNAGSSPASQTLAAPNGAWSVRYKLSGLPAPHLFSASAENVDGVESAPALKSRAGT